MIPTTFSLDYDNTYTRHPELWLKFVEDAHAHGHKVYCITFRYDYECDDIDPRLKQLVEIIPTGRKAKRTFARLKNIYVDVWIDDQPDYIVEGL